MGNPPLLFEISSDIDVVAIGGLRNNQLNRPTIGLAAACFFLRGSPANVAPILQAVFIGGTVSKLFRGFAPLALPASLLRRCGSVLH